MKNLDFITSIKDAFSTLGVNDIVIKKDTLIIPIEQEDNMPAYKIAVSVIEEGYVSIYTSFKHKAVLKKEVQDLLKVINIFNQQSFLKFIVNKEFIKVEYNIPELSFEDIDRVIRVISIIPNILYDFYGDLSKYLE